MNRDGTRENMAKVLLSREASMAAMSLGIGLTQIRKYAFFEPGYFYNALYSITTGIERLGKILLIYDYRLSNQGNFPNNSLLKDCRHNIDRLIASAIQINRNYSFGIKDDFFETDALYEKIISFLSDFAKITRYYNLDYLTGKQRDNEEPLNRWNQEICQVILDRHYRPSRGRLAKRRLLGEDMDKWGASMRSTDESGKTIISAADFLLLGDAVSTKQKYSMYYIYTIVRFLSDIFDQLEMKGNFGYLEELFRIFRCHDRSIILWKKSWNPYSPHHF